MDEPDVELRYGAFNALRTLDPQDPMLGRVRVLDDPRRSDQDQDDAPDAMALAMASASLRPRPEDPFALYIVDSEGPPIVHISRSRRSEIVVFGRAQKLLPPVVLGTGAILLNAADKDEHVEISKIVPSKFGDSDVKLRSSLELAEVLRRVANLGATYPELVSILEAASRQKNLPGNLVVDAVPSSNEDYLAAAILGKDATKKVDPAAKRASAQQPQSRLRRLFWLGGRDAAETTTASAKPTPGSAPKAADSTTAKATAPPVDGSASDSGTSADPSVATLDAKPGQDGNPKKDDALQRAGAEKPSSSPPRTRLLDRLFRSSQ
jgi:hypothetical protein